MRYSTWVLFCFLQMASMLCSPCAVADLENPLANNDQEVDQSSVNIVVEGGADGTNHREIANTAGNELGYVSRPDVSASSLEAREAVNNAGLLSTMSRAQIHDLYRKGVINKATRNRALAELALQEMAGFQSGLQGAPERTVSSAPMDDDVPSFPREIPERIAERTPSIDIAPATTLPMQIVDLTTDYRRRADGAPTTNSESQSAAIAESIPNAVTSPTMPTATVFVGAAGLPAPVGGSHELMNTNTTTQGDEPTAAAKGSSEKAFYSGPSTASSVPESAEELSQYEKVNLALALAKQWQKKTPGEKKDDSKSAQRGPASTDKQASASDQAASAQVAQARNSASTDDGYISDLFARGFNQMVKRPSDLGQWMLQIAGKRTPQVSRGINENEQVSFDRNAFFLGVITIVALIAGAGIVVFRFGRGKREELVLDPKLNDYQIHLSETAGKRLALLQVIERTKKEVVESKQLVAGSVLHARYLPPSLATGLGVENGFEFVKYNGDWSFEKTEEPIAILVHAHKA